MTLFQRLVMFKNDGDYSLSFDFHTCYPKITVWWIDVCKFSEKIVLCANLNSESFFNIGNSYFQESLQSVIHYIYSQNSPISRIHSIEGAGESVYLQKVYNSNNELVMVQERSAHGIIDGLGIIWYGDNGPVSVVGHNYGGWIVDIITYNLDGKILQWTYSDGYNKRAGNICYSSRDNDTLIRCVDCGPKHSSASWPETAIPRQWDLTAPVFTRAYWETKTIDDYNTYIMDCPPNKDLFGDVFCD